MKSVRNVFDQICSFENLFCSFHKARRGKRYRDYAVEFERKLEENLLCLRDELLAGVYVPGRYRAFYINEPKRRLISAAPFRDRVVHHAVIDILEPHFDRSMVEDTYACRRGKGTHAALDRCQEHLCRFEWALKCDIRKFFPSIDHDLLIAKLERKIQDERTMKLLRLIIRTGNSQELVTAWFPGDDLLTPAQRTKGIPIGNLTSQFFANFFLSGFDQFVKRDLGCRGYVRYMDDFILFSDSKDQVGNWLDAVMECLSAIRLKLHPRKQEIFPSKNGASFLGFHVYRERRRLLRANIRLVRKRLRLNVRLRRSGKISWGEFNQSLVSWIGHASHGNTWLFRKALFSVIKF